MKYKFENGELTSTMSAKEVDDIRTGYDLSKKEFKQFIKYLTALDADSECSFHGEVEHWLDVVRNSIQLKNQDNVFLTIDYLNGDKHSISMSDLWYRDTTLADSLTCDKKLYKLDETFFFEDSSGYKHNITISYKEPTGKFLAIALECDPENVKNMTKRMARSYRLISEDKKYIDEDYAIKKFDPDQNENYLIDFHNEVKYFRFKGKWAKLDWETDEIWAIFNY